MAELDEKLNSILSDPEAMGQIVSIAKALAGETQDAPPSPPQTTAQEGGYVPVEGAEPAPAPSPPAPQASQPDWGAVISALSNLSGGGNASGNGGANPLSALGELDPKLVSAAVRLFSEYSATDDKKTALLAALKPFLKEERYAKMDRAVQIARLSRVIRVAFQLFKEGGGSGV